MGILIKDKKFYTAMLMIALPIAGQSVINIGVNLTDTIMLASFGEMQISASSLANQFYFIFNIMCMGIGFGTVVLASQFWGRKDIDSINKAISLMLQITTAAAIIFSIITILFPKQIMGIYSNDPDIIYYGTNYLTYMSFVYLFHGTALTMTLALRSIHALQIGLIGSIASFFINIVSNYIFIFGKLGAPKMEIAGASLGTLIARIFEFAIIFAYVFFIDKKIKFRPKYIIKKPDQAILKDFVRLGSPVIISDMILAFGNSALAMVMGRMGAMMVAANSITAIVVQLSQIFTMGISNASAVVVGNTVGNGEKQRAQNEGVTFLFLSIVLGVISSGIILVISPFIVNFYHISEETKLIVEQLMVSFSIICIFQSISHVMTKGVLRGGGDTRFLMVADVLFLWIASVPLGYLAGLVFGLSPFWVMIFLRIDNVLKSVWCIFRLMSKKWIREV